MLRAARAAPLPQASQVARLPQAFPMVQPPWALPVARLPQAWPTAQLPRAFPMVQPPWALPVARLPQAWPTAQLPRALLVVRLPPASLAARLPQVSLAARLPPAWQATSSAWAPIAPPPQVRETPRAWPSLAARPDLPWSYPRSDRRATFPLWDRCASRADAAFGSRDRSSRRISAGEAPLYPGGCSRWPNPRQTSPRVTFAAFAAGSSAWHSVADVGLTGSGGSPVWCW
jgi:hypothetical protein